MRVSSSSSSAVILYKQYDCDLNQPYSQPSAVLAISRPYTTNRMKSHKTLPILHGMQHTRDQWWCQFFHISFYSSISYSEFPVLCLCDISRCGQVRQQILDKRVIESNVIVQLLWLSVQTYLEFCICYLDSYAHMSKLATRKHAIHIANVSNIPQNYSYQHNCTFTTRWPLLHAARVSSYSSCHTLQEIHENPKSWDLRHAQKSIWSSMWR